MSRSGVPGNGALHLLAGVAAAGLSHLVVPVRHSGDFLVRAVLWTVLSALLLDVLFAA